MASLVPNRLHEIVQTSGLYEGPSSVAAVQQDDRLKSAEIVVPGTQEVAVPTKPGPLDAVELHLMRDAGGVYRQRGEQVEGAPVVHRFTPGMYIRQITMPAGAAITSEIHKTEHPYVVSQGECLVLVEGKGWIQVTAPHSSTTYPGTRRLLFILSETVWTTFHVNPDDCRDIVTIENRILVSYKNPLLNEFVPELLETNV